MDLPKSTLTDEPKPVATSADALDEAFANLVAGTGAASGTEGRREFICQEGRIYARLRLGSGRKRNKQNGGYIYKGHIEKFRNDPRWQTRIREYATSHACHYPHPDLESYRGKPSGTGIRPSGSEGDGLPLALIPPPDKDWTAWPSGNHLPS